MPNDWDYEDYAGNLALLGPLMLGESIDGTAKGVQRWCRFGVEKSAVADCWSVGYGKGNGLFEIRMRAFRQSAAASQKGTLDLFAARKWHPDKRGHRRFV